MNIELAMPRYSGSITFFLKKSNFEVTNIMSNSWIKAFTELTRSSPEVARQYFERYNGDLSAAVNAFAADQDSGGTPPTTGTNWRTRATAKAKPRRGVATLRDLGEDSSDTALRNSDTDPRFYAGGEKSGLSVQNPESEGPRSVIREIMSKVIRYAGSSAENSEESAFSGQGFRLGSTSSPSETVGSVPSERVRRTLIFWRNGFSVDDGELYRFDDPANIQYLNAINRGIAPLHILNVNPNQNVDVQIDQRPNEDYHPPHNSSGPCFLGSGNRLGNVSPSVEVASYIESENANGSSTPQQTDGDTAVQIRLVDGSVHRCCVRGSGPVGQLYDFVDKFGNKQAYVLQTTYPVKRLENREQSIDAAGVNNSVVVQRYIV